MHPGVLAALDETAQRRVLAAATSLGQRFGLEGEIAALQTATARDFKEAALRQREATAALLERLVEVTEPGTPGEPRAGTVGPLSLDSVDIPPRARHALREAGYFDVPSALAAPDEDLLALTGVGPATLEALRAAAAGQAE